MICLSLIESLLIISLFLPSVSLTNSLNSNHNKDKFVEHSESQSSTPSRLTFKSSVFQVLSDYRNPCNEYIRCFDRRAICVYEEDLDIGKCECEPGYFASGLGYPLCNKPTKIGEICESSKACKLNDPNSFCSLFDTCKCEIHYVYDKHIRKCVYDPNANFIDDDDDSSSFSALVVGFILFCISMFLLLTCVIIIKMHKEHKHSSNLNRSGNQLNSSSTISPRTLTTLFNREHNQPPAISNTILFTTPMTSNQSYPNPNPINCTKMDSSATSYPSSLTVPTLVDDQPPSYNVAVKMTDAK